MKAVDRNKAFCKVFEMDKAVLACFGLEHSGKKGGKTLFFAIFQFFETVHRQRIDLPV